MEQLIMTQPAQKVKQLPLMLNQKNLQALEKLNGPKLKVEQEKEKFIEMPKVLKE